MPFSPGDLGPAIGVIGGAIGIVATLVPFVRWTRRRIAPPLPFEVHRITSADDPDLAAALRLYEGRFAQTPNEMDDIETIKAAIRNDKDSAEYLMIATRGIHPIAMMWGSFCEIDSIFWIWYVAGFKGDTKTGYLEPTMDGEEASLGERELKLMVGAAFEKMFEMIMTDKQVRDCTRVAMEVSDHVYASKSALFAARVNDMSGRLYKMGIAYRQPLLVFPSTEAEVPMTLLLADLPRRPTRSYAFLPILGLKGAMPEQSPVYRQKLSSVESMQIIGCLYAHMYSEREESDAWLAYIQREQARTFALIGDGVKLESIRPRRLRS